MVFVATARNSSNAPPPVLDSALALSYSPLSPHEGTTTFQKPVAIKRIAPALVGDEELVGAFLDTARIVTGIRHSNVAQIHEVGRVGTDVFLVMDCLMGETAATLMRKLHSRGETLDCLLAAHIIAEASAGLQAAHERGVLHKRLTPHDLFIGYDGSVRVLDIGIAAARGRLAGEPEGGKLELEYSSPERCRQAPVDGRSDVFSLGTMLWELNTGISPFERAKEGDTIRAICEEPIIAPSHVVPGLPEDVSAITMRALARDPDQRYPSALALRHALVGLMRRLGGNESLPDELSRLMNVLFEKRVRDKREMLRRIESGATLADLDIGEAEETTAPRTVQRVPSQAPPPRVDHDEPSVIVEPPSGPELGIVPSQGHLRVPAVAAIDTGNHRAIPGLPRARKKPTRSTHLVVWGVTLLLVLGGTALASMGLRRGKTEGTSRPATTAEPGPSAAPVLPEPTASTLPAAAPVEETVLNIETIPTHATIVVGGAKKGVSPIELRVPKSSDPVTVEIRHTGYQTMKERIVPDVNQRLKLTLVATREPGAAPAASARYHKFE